MSYSDTIRNPGEKIYAQLLESKNIIYEHQPQTLQLNNYKYRPDFYLPFRNKYIEIVNSKQSFIRNIIKYKLAIETFDIEFLKPNGDIFCDSKDILNFEKRKEYILSQFKSINKKANYIGFYINPDLKKEFQKLCIDRDTDITNMLKDFILVSVKEHLSNKSFKSNKIEKINHAI